MNLPKSRQLKDAASNAIGEDIHEHRKLAGIYTAAMLGLSLLVLIFDFVLEQQIGNTGGLGGVGVRSVLQTAQNVLKQAQVIALPFWQIGWLYTTVKIARQEKTGAADLLEGFRRFFPFLRLTILKGLIFIALAIGAAYAGALVAMMTPLGTPVMELAMSDLTQMTEAQLFAQMEQLMIPVMAVSAAVAFVVIVPFFYRFRMAEYIMLDSGCGARAALRGSRQLMRGNMWRMMGLDLSFWWFWLLSLVASALAYSDAILPLAGVSIPWSNSVSYFAAFLLAAAAQLVLNYYCKVQLDATYAHAYMALLPKEEMYESH